jgi:hypothetical protein
LKKAMVSFFGGALAGWLLLAVLVYALWGREGLFCLTVGGAICIVPAGLSLFWSLHAAGRSSSEQILAVMGGMFLRMLFVLAVGIAVFLVQPWFQEVKERAYVYWGSLLLFYLMSLALETIIAARYKPNSQATTGSN